MLITKIESIASTRIDAESGITSATEAISAKESIMQNDKAEKLLWLI